MSTLFTSLPRHLYCHVERNFLGDAEGLEPASWFGLTSVPGRAWGLSLLLECGAIYSHVPPHAITFSDRQAPDPWPLERAQLWDCFGYDFAVHEYDHLSGRAVECRWPDGLTDVGRYLFTAQHYDDGFSLAPAQAKQYHFIELNNGRLCTLPANCILISAPEFTGRRGWPDWLRRQTLEYSAELHKPIR